MTLLTRFYYFLLFFGCHELIVTAMYFEHALGLEPCPLCMLQRLAVVGAGIAFLANAVGGIRPTIRTLFDAVAALSAGFGLFIAARHSWLQSLPPDQVPECGPGLEYIVDTFPVLEGFMMILQGSGECAEVAWSFLGLSMPNWMIVVFTCLAVVSLANILLTNGKIILTEHRYLAS